MKRLILTLCLVLAACGPYVPPNEVCVASHEETNLVPMPTMTTDGNGNMTTTITLSVQTDDVCDQWHTLTPEEKQELIKEHSK